MADLSCEAIARSFRGRPVLRDVSFTVPSGTVSAVLGASGSGKTTLLRVITGFLRAESGTVRVGARVVESANAHVAPERRGIGYVAQEGALFPHLSVGDNIGFGLPRSERREGHRAAELLELVGLGGDHARRQPHELSGGEQRRVALARALAPRPAIILLDEPFSGLDASLRAETRAAVLTALRESGSTAVIVTHDQAEAMSTGREVALLRDGELVQTGPPADLYHRPVDLDAARFLGDAVVLRGRVDGASVDCALGRLAAGGPATGGDVEVMVRPEQVEIVGAGTPGAVDAEVIALDFYGARSVATLKIGAEAVHATQFSQSAPQPGSRVHVRVTGPVRVYPRANGSA